MPIKIISHSKKITQIASNHGWYAGAKYTNYRDIRNIEKVALVDIDWINYDFHKHLEMVKITNPFFTVARDIFKTKDLSTIVKQANELKKYVEYIIFVPKKKGIISIIASNFNNNFILGFSVPSKYGMTNVSVDEFRNYPVHLLGGRPDLQRKLANELNVVSIDGNRLTLDAKYGDYFDLETFRPHPLGGYKRCIQESIKNINLLWSDYEINSQDITIKKKFEKWTMKII